MKHGSGRQGDRVHHKLRLQTNGGARDPCAGSSGLSAARAIIAGQTSVDWHDAMQRRLRRPMRVARMAWAVAENPRWNGAGLRLASAMPWSINLIARLTRVPS